METEIKHEKQDSISISKGTTGKYGWSIKLYFEDGTEVAEQIIERIKGLNDKLKETFDKPEE